MRVLYALSFVDEALTRLRFAGTDQNPHGIRDLFTSARLEVERTRKALAAIEEDMREQANGSQDGYLLEQAQKLRRVIDKL